MSEREEVVGRLVKTIFSWVDEDERLGKVITYNDIKKLAEKLRDEIDELHFF